MYIPGVGDSVGLRSRGLRGARPGVLSYPLKPHGFGSSYMADLWILIIDFPMLIL
jgi:hypothetical protein